MRKICGPINGRYIIAFLVCFLWVGCGAEGGPPQDPIDPGPDFRGRTYFHEHELSENNRATYDHEILLNLESLETAGLKGTLVPDQDRGSGLVLNKLFFQQEKDGPHEFCIDAQDQYLKKMVLEDTGGRALLEMDQGGECLTINLRAGDYNMLVYHSAEGISERGRVGFVRRTNKPRLGTMPPDPAAAADRLVLPTGGEKGWWTFHNSQDPNQTAQTDYSWSYNTSCYDGRNVDNYIVKTISTKSGPWEFFQPRTSEHGLTLVSQHAPSLKWNLAPGWNDCGYNTNYYNVQTDSMDSSLDRIIVYVYCKTYYAQTGYFNLQTGAAYHNSNILAELEKQDSNGCNHYDDLNKLPVTKEFIRDLGNYQFQFGHTLSNGATNYMCMSPGSEYMHGLTDSANNNFFYETSPCNKTFTVRFRYYEDGADVPELQEGEMALFTDTDFRGRALVFIGDINLPGETYDFDNTISSIKFGPRTGAVMWDNTDKSKANAIRLEGVEYEPGSYANLSLLSPGWNDKLSLIEINSAKSILLSTRDGAYANLEGVELSGADLSGVWLSHSNLRGADLSGANLTDSHAGGTDFSEADLSRVDFSGAYVAWAYFSNATLTGADFSGADVKNSRFTHTSLVDSNGNPSVKFDSIMNTGQLFQNRTDFTDSTIGYGSFDISNWRYLNMTDAVIENIPPSGLTGADFRGGIFQGVDFSNLNLDGLKAGCDNGQCTDLSRADFNSSSLNQADLSLANLKGASLVGASVKEANLEKANLRGAGLNNADLSRSNLTNITADMTTACNNDGRAEFDGAFLIDATLDGARLNCASFTYASIYKLGQGVSMVDANLQGADLSNALLYGLDLSKGKLAQAHLSGANLVEADLTGADLTDAILTRAFLQGADLTEAILNKADLSRANLSFDGDGSSTTFNIIDETGNQVSKTYFYSPTVYTTAVTSLDTICPDTYASSTGCQTKDQWTAPDVIPSGCVPTDSQPCPRPE